jgi:hypothetical protein
MNLIDIRNHVTASLEEITGLTVMAQGCGDGMCDIDFDYEGVSYLLNIGRADREEAATREPDPLVESLAEIARAIYVLAATYDMHRATSVEVDSIRRRADALRFRP